MIKDNIYNNIIHRFDTELMTNVSGKNPCVVFDIDGTLIYENDIETYKEKLIIDICKFAYYLNSNNIPIFIVTARDMNVPNNYEDTEKLLDRLNINYMKLYLWDIEEYKTVVDFKSLTRKNIEDKNYKVIMSLGDNYWDYGDYGGTGIHIFENGKFIQFV
tara:strand:- start:296 stop:775 length:480 start_codon:yes stop_codon:yes gene_type:complete